MLNKSCYANNPLFRMPRTYATKTGGGGGGSSNKPFQDHRDPKPLFKETFPKRAAPGCEYRIDYCTSFTQLVLDRQGPCLTSKRKWVEEPDKFWTIYIYPIYIQYMC